MKRRTTIYLEQRQVAALEEAATAQGITRAEVIRQLIERGIGAARPSDLEADLAAIEQSFGVLGGEDRAGTLIRGPDARARHLKRSPRISARRSPPP